MRTTRSTANLLTVSPFASPVALVVVATFETELAGDGVGDALGPFALELATSLAPIAQPLGMRADRRPVRPGRRTRGVLSRYRGRDRAGRRATAAV